MSWLLEAKSKKWKLKKGLFCTAIAILTRQTKTKSTPNCTTSKYPYISGEHYKQFK